MPDIQYMEAANIEGSNVAIGANQDEYNTLFGRVETDADGSPLIVTEWKVTPQMIETLQAGGSVYLITSGLEFVPVRIAIAPSSPEQEVEDADAQG